LQALADQLTDIVTDSVLTIKRPGEPLDLHMVLPPVQWTPFTENQLLGWHTLFTHYLHIGVHPLGHP
jgi:hypothetical protein